MIGLTDDLKMKGEVIRQKPGKNHQSTEGASRSLASYYGKHMIYVDPIYEFSY